MNIFASYDCPIKSAEFLDNKRLVKMVLETAQLLSTAINVSGGVAPYKTTHKNHPCSIWARDSVGNYLWLLTHFDALCAEYTKRYGKVHKCQGYRAAFEDGVKHIRAGERAKFANCTTFKEERDVCLAYRKYLAVKWEQDALKKSTVKENSEVVVAN